MSDAESQSSLDPYAPPKEVGYVGSAPKRSPGGLKAVCIISIVLGGLGLASALLNLVMLFVGPMMQQAFTPAPTAQAGPQREMVVAQQEMQAELAEVNQRFFVFQLIAGLAHLVIATMLLAGGIMALNINPTGRTILLAGCGTAILFEMARAVLTTLIGIESAAISGRYMERMMEATAGAQGNGPDPQAMSTVISAFTYAGLAVGLMFVVGKIIYYVFSVVYLRKPNIVVMYQ